MQTKGGHDEIFCLGLALQSLNFFLFELFRHDLRDLVLVVCSYRSNELTSDLQGFYSINK